jgi:hypothetical protein
METLATRCRLKAAFQFQGLKGGEMIWRAHLLSNC